MIAYRMLYAVVVGVPILLAAFAVTGVLRRHGRPERWVWLAALCLALLLPAASMLGPLGPRPTASAENSPAASATVDGPTADGRAFRFPNVFFVSPSSPGPGLDEALLIAWLLVSAGLTARWLISHKRLGRLLASWRTSNVDGSDVWLAPESGPAVTGMLRTRIIVPEWLLSLPGDQRSLVLLHEEEHVRARDPWLMTVCRLARIAAPWNPVVWALSSQLLRAVELDCDRRVLRSHPDVRRYCDTLFAISARQPSRLVGAAAFAEPQVPLQKRIVSMTTPPRSLSGLTVLLLLVVGAVFVAGSCGVPLPTERDATVQPSILGGPSTLVVSLTPDGRVTVDEVPRSMGDVSAAAADRVETSPDPLVTAVVAPKDMPYQYIDELLHRLIAANATRVVLATDRANVDDGFGIVLPELGRGVRLPDPGAANVLNLTVQPDGRVAARLGESGDAQVVTADQVEEMWRRLVAEQPKLIANLGWHPYVRYGSFLDVLDALHSANAQRISLFGGMQAQ